MNILMCFIFLVANLTTVGISMFSYGDRGKYMRGMIMGVHIPADMVNHKDVQKICQENKKVWDKFNWINFILAVAICAFIFLSFEGFMVIWCIWLGEYIAGLRYLVITPHRKMYQLKIENNWMDEKSKRMVYVDLKTSVQAAKAAISWKYHGIMLLLMVISGLVLFYKKNQSMIKISGWVFFGLSFGVSIMFLILHLILVRKNEVYSENEDINLTINQVSKRSWSVGLLIADTINVISWLYVAVRLVCKDWIGSMDFFIYIILQLISAFIIIVPVFLIQKRKRELLTIDTAPVYVDDDEYWKKGWYNNPNDKRIMVQDRMSTANYTFNMGNPIAKVLNAGLIALLLVVLLGTGVFMISLSGSHTEFSINGTAVKIKASMYKCEFDVSEIESVELLTEMPKENFFRTNGAATDHYSIGYFSGNKSGACMLFLYEGQKPILKITLPEKTVFANSETSGEVEQWFEILSK